FSNSVIFDKIVCGVSFRLPHGIPIFDYSVSDAMRISFLSHYCLLLSFSQHDCGMAHSLFNTISSTLCSRSDSLHCWSIICVAFLYIKVFCMHSVVVFSVCNC